MLRPELADKVLIKRLLVDLPNSIPRYSIWNALNDSSDIETFSCAVRYGFIGEQVQIQIILLKDFHKQPDDL